MRKIFTLIAIAASLQGIAASKTITLGNVELNLDTIYHAKIGPGMTRTQLHLSGSQPIDVHYITIDKNSKGVSLKAVRGATDNGLEKTSEMGKRITGNGIAAIAGINGDFFDVTKTYPDGSMRPRMTTYTTIIDGEIHRTSPQGHQFVVDASGNPSITLLDFSSGTVNCGERSVSLGGVNIENINYSGDSAPDNAVTVYTGKGWKSTSQSQYEGNCAEIAAVPLDDNSLNTGSICSFLIKGTAETSGNMTIPENGCVLFGRGTGKTFIESLSEGDIVTIKPEIRNQDGKSLIPILSVGGNPPVVSKGIALESDGTRPDAVDLHPRTGVGISKDGSKIIFMTVDGRGVSVGATTRQLGDLLVHAGAEEGLNFDGGGSSTCWTSPFGVINKCSDAAGERTVANSLFALAEGDPADKTIAEIRFEGWKYSLMQGETLTPVIYGYNRAGILIDTNLDHAILTCPESLGVIDNSKKELTASETSGMLRAEYNGLEAQVPVEIIPVDFKAISSEPANWSITKTQVKTATLSNNNNTLILDYQMGPTVSNPSITMRNAMAIEGKPLGMRIGIASKTSAVTEVSVAIKAANESSPKTFEIEEKDVPSFAIIKFADKFDLSDEAVYPLTFSSISVKPAEAKGETGQVTFSTMDFIYSKSSGIDEINSDNIDVDNMTEEWYSITGVRMDPTNLTPGIYIRRKGSSTNKILIK